ncbi:MAG: PAS domain S-box protein, partial [Deltaproteobacteria bacterium]|nr:PAS domain S-box protein [Deltaproteobacteria bacterium]
LAGAIGLILFRQRQALVNAHELSQAQADKLHALHLLDAIADSSSDAIFAKDLDDRFILFNQAAERLSGKQCAEVLGRDELVVFPPELATQLIADNRRVMMEKRVITFEEELVTPEGLRTYLTTKGPLHDPEGGIIGMYGIARNISERKQAEMALRQSEARSRLLLDSTAEAIYGVDLKGNCTFVNPACLRLLGYAHEDELIGRHVHEVIHHTRADGSPYPARECRAYDVHRSKEGVHVDDEVFWHKDNTAIQVEYWAYPIRNEGAVIGTVVTWLDISERRIAEAQLRKLSLAVEQSPESIVITNLDAKIEYVNAAFLRATGYSQEEVIGQNPRFLHSGHTVPENHAALWEALTRGQSWKGEFINRRKDGSEYVEFAIITPLRQSDGRITHYVAVKEDITNKKRLGQELDRHRLHLEVLVAERTAALSEAEEKYRTVADFTYDWETWIDASGNWLYCSPACERITGHCAEDFIAQSNLYLDIVHPEDRARVLHHLTEDEGGGLEYAVFRIINQNGE